jgi:hypothetical protein
MENSISIPQSRQFKNEEKAQKLKKYLQN